MTLNQFLCVLRARRGLIALVLLCVMGLALAWVLLRPATYVARAPVLVDVRTDPVGTTPIQGMVSPTYVSSQIDIVKSQRVAARVVELLPRDQPPMAQLRAEARERGMPDTWLAQALQQGLDVKPARESNIINITWTGSTPAEAARVANAFAQAYADTHLSLRTAPAGQYSAWFDEQVRAARDRLEKAQTRLSDSQEKAGIISSTEQGDYERQHLAELTEQLLAAQARPRSSASGGENSGAVTQLRGEVARIESKVQEASATLGANHPKMQQMQAELRSMRSRLSAESARAARSAQATTQASAERIRELQAQVAAQKQRVLSTSRRRGDLSVLQREVESAQKAYDTVAASAAQSRLQSVATQGNVVFLGSAVEPLDASGPSAKLALGAAFGGGLLLAIAAALMAEFANRRVRSVADLEGAANVSVLGIVPAPASRLGGRRLGYTPRRLELIPYRSIA